MLVLRAGALCNVADGSSEPLAEAGAESIARAARRLLPVERERFALLLPGHEFLALALELPGVPSEQLHDAILLQQPDLLPGVEQEMLLQVVPAGDGKQVISLWLPMERAESLFHACETRGLFLDEVVPRSALLPLADGGGAPAGGGWACDEEEGFVTCVEWSRGRIVQWLTTARRDLELEPLREQWLAALGGVEPERADPDSAWRGVTAEALAALPRFVPDSARLRRAERSRARARRIQLRVAAVVGALLLGFWALLSARIAYYEGKLETLRAEAREATRLRAEVVEIETRLAPVRDFPDQGAAELMGRLNGAIPEDSWIERLRLEEGVVELEGYSPDPAGLVAALADDPRFRDVAFSRATRGGAGSAQGDRFGIRFRLEGVDVAAYLEEHFPVER